MDTIEAFADETNPIYKCPHCRWMFSPALTMSERLRESVDLIRMYAPELLTPEARESLVIIPPVTA